MSHHHRAFLVVEGQNNRYPDSEFASVSLSLSDPASCHIPNLFVSSPLFAFDEEGVAELPFLSNGSKITFAIVPTVYPVFLDILKKFKSKNQFWFSLGVANFVIIEEPEDDLSDNVIEELKSGKNVLGVEQWVIQNGTIDTHSRVGFTILHEASKVHSCNIAISDGLPLYLKFSLSEYIISVDKFLTASSKFTPQYFEKHKATIENSKDFIYDLAFLFGDESFIPTNALLGTLNAKSVDEAKAILQRPEARRKREELINDRHGMIVQFNSSLSYIYSQAYAGVFPVLSHHGLIRRYSLLGIGTAVASLFELIIQIETAIFTLPFEELDSTIYKTAICSNPKWYVSFLEPSLFEIDCWLHDEVRDEVINMGVVAEPVLPEDFFHRLSFFSGRLGFREYEFNATAAIQVLVEGHSLNWNVINYSHEIIHHHVRLILDQLITPPLSRRGQSYEDWLEKFRGFIKDAFNGAMNGKDIRGISYKDYFTLILLKFAVNSTYYGSLTRISDDEEINSLRADAEKRRKLFMPSAAILKELVQNLYKDITEIFVHIADFAYIYKRNVDTYLLSIWLSWSTIPAVTNDLKQYILRTLIVIGLSETGDLKDRFGNSVARFRKVLHVIRDRGMHETIGIEIESILDSATDFQDLQFRYYNCSIVGDMVNNYFIGKIEDILDGKDENRMDEDSTDEQGNRISYQIATNSFAGKPILSKVRFLLDQLEREISRFSNQRREDEIERNAAWLLLSLSSHHGH